MEIKDWVSGARKAARMTQDQLADELGVTRGNVSAWERGRHEPNLSQIERIAAICKADTSQVFGKVTKSGTWPFSFSLEKYKALPEDKQSRIDGYISGIIDEWEISKGKRKSA